MGDEAEADSRGDPGVGVGVEGGSTGDVDDETEADSRGDPGVGVGVEGARGSVLISSSEDEISDTSGVCGL